MTATAGRDLLALYRRAEQYFDAKDFSEAARLLSDVVAEAPGQLDARLLLARARYHSAQLAEAEREAHRVLEQDPTEAYARLLLGRTLQRQGRETEAETQLRLAAVLSGEQWDVPRRLEPDQGAARP